MRGHPVESCFELNSTTDFDERKVCRPKEQWHPTWIGLKTILSVLMLDMLQAN
jgi:hypothetical protein